MIQRRIVVLLLAILLASPALQAGAQTPAASRIPEENELTGIQAAVWRMYGTTETFVGEATIIAATPIASVAGMPTLRSISVVVREFDNVEHAASAFEQISAGASGSLPTAFQGGTLKVTNKEVAGVGLQSTLIRMDYASDVSKIWLEYAIVQRDQYIFFVEADGSVFRNMPGSGEVDTSLPTAEIATAIATNGKPSPEEPTLKEDGTSTGGLWGFMPPADDPLLMGMIPVFDSILYPTPRT